MRTGISAGSARQVAMAAPLNLAAVQSNLRQLGHDVSEEAIVHMLKDLDLSRLLGQVPRSHSAAAMADAPSQSRCHEFTAQAALGGDSAEQKHITTGRADAVSLELRGCSVRSASGDSVHSLQSTSDSAAQAPGSDMPRRSRHPQRPRADSGSQLSSHDNYSMFSSDAAPSRTPLPSADGMSEGTSIFPEQDEEDNSGYYISARTADLVCMSSRVLLPLRSRQREGMDGSKDGSLWHGR